MRTPSTGNAAPPDDDAQTSLQSGEARPAGGKAAKNRAATSSTVNGRPAPRLPHERDESSDSTDAAPSEAMRRAHDDVTSGKRATDKGEATDAVYRRNLRGRMPGSERD